MNLTKIPLSMTDYKGALEIASAAILPVVVTSDYYDVTGTVAITSIATADGDGALIAPTIKVHFDGALTLTHHATNLILPGAANITTAAGDEFEFTEYGAGTWRCTGYVLASGKAIAETGRIAQLVNTQDGALATGSTAMPQDDTIPQNTEGDQYMSLAITPAAAANKLKIEVIAQCGTSGAGNLAAALFQDATAAALAGTVGYCPAAANPTTLVFTHYMAAGTTSATTFKVRIGSGGTITFNDANAGRLLGGITASSITITEIIV